MSGARPLEIAERHSLPLAHLSFDLSRSRCGNRMWALRFAPPAEMAARDVPLANGFCDSEADRAGLAAELRALADAVEAM